MTRETPVRRSDSPAPALSAELLAAAAKYPRICGMPIPPGSVLDGCAGSLLGLSLGDRLGLPLEMKPRAEILRITGGRGVTGYLDPNVYRKKARKWGVFPGPGAPSDDTLSAMAVLASMAGQPGGAYHPVASAKAGVKAAKSVHFAGYGGTTRVGLRELERYFNRKPDGRSPNVCPNRTLAAPGKGNAPPMRIAAIALREAFVHPRHSASVVSRSEFFHEVFAEARLTHGDPSPAIGAAFVAYAIVAFAGAFNMGDGHVPSEWEAFATLAGAEIHTAIKALYADSGIRSGADIVAFTEAWGDGWFNALRDYELVFEAIARLFRRVRGPTINQLIAITGTGAPALESVPLALAIAFLRRHEPAKALSMAVNAGGDTDTIASMAMAVVGAGCGAHGLPRRLLMPKGLPGVTADYADILRQVGRFLLVLPLPAEEHDHVRAALALMG